jgi:hypothetical protein
MNLYCEKCNSNEVEIIDIISPTMQEQQKQSIADFKGFPMTTDLVYRPRTMLIRCKNCGNKKEITQ